MMVVGRDDHTEEVGAPQIGWGVKSGVGRAGLG